MIGKPTIDVIKKKIHAHVIEIIKCVWISVSFI